MSSQGNINWNNHPKGKFCNSLCCFKLLRKIHSVWCIIYDVKISGYPKDTRDWRKDTYYGLGCCCCCCLVTKSYLTPLRPHGLHPTRLLCPWNSPGKNTEVGCHFLLQEILIQGSNPCLPHWQADSLPLSHLGSPGYNWIKKETI